MQEAPTLILALYLVPQCPRINGRLRSSGISALAGIQPRVAEAVVAAEAEALATARAPADGRVGVKVAFVHDPEVERHPRPGSRVGDRAVPATFQNLGTR